MKGLMELRPELNEKLMEFYCYLLDMKPNYLENPSDDVDMGLDEMIWNLGLNLPSWDDELPNGDN